MVGAHLQEAADHHAQPDAAAIAEQDVQDDLVPPAFGEVGKQVHEEELQKTTGVSTVGGHSPHMLGYEVVTHNQVGGSCFGGEAGAGATTS